TLTTGSYVTDSSSLAVGGGRTTMTTGITARGCAVRPPSPVAHTGGGATSCASAITRPLLTRSAPHTQWPGECREPGSVPRHAANVSPFSVPAVLSLARPLRRNSKDYLAFGGSCLRCHQSPATSLVSLPS